MFYSAIAYSLTLVLAFTLIPLSAFFLRMLLILTFSRLYNGFSSGNPLQTLKFSIKIAQPIGFLTAIFHGYAALWMGVVLLNGMGQDVDLFLSIMLGFCFLWFGWRKLQQPPKIQVNNNHTFTNSDGEQTTLILNPSEQEDTPAQQSKEAQEALQQQLRSQAQEFMQENTVIGLIGKLTGVTVGTLSLVLPLIS